MMVNTVIRKSCFTDTCCSVMEFFLSNAGLYFTPTAAALSMGKPLPTVKDCMRLLRQNNYLSKLSDNGTVYYITEENMEFWHTDFKAYILDLHESSGGVG